MVIGKLPKFVHRILVAYVVDEREVIRQQFNYGLSTKEIALKKKVLKQVEGLLAKDALLSRTNK